VLPVLYLCTGTLAPAYEGLELGVGDAVLAKVLAEATGCRDRWAQAYLLDSALAVFPAAWHRGALPALLGALPALVPDATTLRVVLVENLRRLAERLATHKAAREAANLVCDQLPACSVEMLEELRCLLARRGVAVCFLAQMAQRLHDGALEVDAKVPAAVLDWLHAALPNLALVQAQQAMEQTADNLSVSNAVTSLRQIGDTDWPDIVGRTSALMRLMLSSASFAAEHGGTRDRTLHVIEHLARRSRRSEIEVAQILLGLMKVPCVSGEPATSAEQAETQPVADDTTAAHWLAGGGSDTLNRALGLHADPWLAWQAVLRQAALPLYLGAAVLGTLVLMAWVLLPERATLTAYGTWMASLVAVLTLLPASEAAVALIHRLVSESTRPHSLSRLALVDGIPAQHRVMVVVPALLTDTQAIDRLVHRLVLHWLANPERHAQFALLSDWADAATEHAPGDEALLAHAVAQIRVVNARHPMAGHAESGPRFIVLHRQRTHSRSEQAWIGWDRKRGKLEQLVAALATGDHSAFVDLGEASLIAAGTRHLVTLDSDTQLPPGRLRELVSVAAHPDNQPQLDAAGQRVVSGYGILQPRIVTPLPTPSEDTAFRRLFAGQCGIDPYSSASSEVYQDLFGEGSFTGKGLLQVDAVHAVLCGRLPEGTVLSHDLLEGSIARCAAVSDITLIEDAPGHAEVAASRVHRWTRGDWQLLPFLLQPGRWPLGAVNRWKFIDNLRRSLLPSASLALLTVMIVGPGLSPCERWCWCSRLSPPGHCWGHWRVWCPPAPRWPGRISSVRPGLIWCAHSVPVCGIWPCCCNMPPPPSTRSRAPFGG
jgi:cyclic beta-1,2-glucan synthetase